MLNENVVYAKSILSKNGITKDSPEYADFIKIRQICGDSNNYVGVLTKIRFIDNISDMEELESIFNVLKNSKLDINKMNKMSYDDILSMFYDELSGVKTENKDYELVFKDSEYSYYLIKTYEGIMQLSSPAWCLKTKSKYEEYKSVYSHQYIIILNEYRNKLLCPNDNYLTNYKVDKGYIRYGISIKNEDGRFSFASFDDNNGKCEYKYSSHTFYGVINTVFNLYSGINKSYYDSHLGCEGIGNGWLKIVNLERFCGRMNDISKSFFEGYESSYVRFSKDYNALPLFLRFGNNKLNSFTPCKKGTNTSVAIIKPFTIAWKLISDYAVTNNSNIYLGIKLNLGLKKIEDIENIDGFLIQIGRWLVFEHNENYLCVVNSDISSGYAIPYMYLDGSNFNIKNPLYWYIDIKSKNPIYGGGFPFYKEVIDEIFYHLNDDEPVVKVDEPIIKNDDSDDKSEKKLKSFWNFFKSKENKK